MHLAQQGASGGRLSQRAKLYQNPALLARYFYPQVRPRQPDIPYLFYKTNAQGICFFKFSARVEGLSPEQNDVSEDAVFRRVAGSA